ncbi:hypothetical protein [uncultured Parabacteroides sp.]|uniref:hypothetical protein n=1 Tax=uncultured Parabacteroides sp. TaxID=512312 RepID=UPI00259B388A|nr:hypothetical protein [uncultured Parabacteroides sp.]
MKKSTILFLLLFTLGCTSLGFGIGRTIYKQILVEIKDTIFSSDIVFIPEPELVDIFIPEPPALIDTSAIIQDYLSAKIYNDTLAANNSIVAILKDTVYQNSLVGRTFTYTLTTPVIKCPQRPFSLLLTADTRLSTSLIITKNRWLIQGGYDFKDKFPFLGVGFKIY